MRHTLPRLVAAAATLLAAPAFAQAGNVTTVTVQADRPGPRIDRNIFGQFAEHLGTGIYGGVWVGKDSPIPNVRGIRSDVVAALKTIRVPVVRWPGGCFADEYHWRDGLGDPARRKQTVNANWGGAAETNAFGTDEFMDFVGQIGAEAYVSVNVGSGTVKEAADWVAYMTADQQSSAGQERAANGHPAPYKVKYLGIGNESWSCGGAMRPEFYTDQMKLYARFVRNYNPAQAKDEPMQRIAVGPSDDDTSYTEAVMKAWKAHDWSWNIEGLSFHSYTVGGWPPSYPSTGFGEDDYAKLVKATLAMDGRIATHSAIMDKYDPEKKMPLVVDEWGVWLAPLPGTNPGFLAQQNSLRDAIIAALNVNIFARHADRVRMTNIAQMVNVLQAMILTDGPKMVLTPTYHVFKMYLPFQDATFVPVSFEAGRYRRGDVELPRVDAVAARATDGKLWLALVNVDPNETSEIRVAVPGLSVRRAGGQVLTAANVNSVNTFEAPDTVVPKPITGRVEGGAVTVRLPARSVAMLSLER
ncbi:alpha-N-arabinofuranosidase [Sphingomonas cannabina]|uniref:alpha-N-arabinofuranosidase n=1 Tax=Sphingomonas cannabina TaxID=2899123 RepID=UPI001F1A9D37|nr:alpha-L-arabinofuranosidase C-terminal domain-containing protein [Sphingomonas cannabina]UIJ46655.1 alpha-N-arabinofuranosidase [Sphingomonas cannabina]